MAKIQKNVAFLGLGVMGYPMAGHLLKAGHNVSVWNRSKQKAEKWADNYNGQNCDTIEQAVQNADFIMLCVGEDKDVFAVVREVLAHAPKGALIVDHTTASDKCARECYEMSAKCGIGFLDAPISGGEAGAINGQLAIMCGGDKSDFERAKPIMQAYGKSLKYMGSSGAGQLTKMVNQICIAGILQGLSEAVNFAQKAGLDIDEVVEAIGQGAASSWQLLNRASTMAKDEFEFGFAVDWMRKDLGIALDTAQKNGADLTLTKMVDEYYQDIQNMGGGRWDTSSLIKRINKG